MEDKLIALLEDFGFPVYRQGSLSADEDYPADFFTFWNRNSQDHAHYDNVDYGTTWEFDINFYSDNPIHTYDFLAQARAVLKAAGWIIDGKGYDVRSDEPTHTGRGMRALYLETY